MTNPSVQKEQSKLLGLIKWKNDTKKELKPFLEGIVKALASLDDPELMKMQRRLAKVDAELKGLKNGARIKKDLADKIKRNVTQLYRKLKSPLLTKPKGKRSDLIRMQEAIAKARSRRLGKPKRKACVKINLSPDNEGSLRRIQKAEGLKSLPEALSFVIEYYEVKGIEEVSYLRPLVAGDHEVKTLSEKRRGKPK